MDGPWQLGHVPADQYAIRAQQAAKMMKDMDPSIELVACGSCTTGLPTYMEWDRAGARVHRATCADYISLHRYVGNRERRHARLPGGHQLASTSRSRRWTPSAASCRPGRRSKKRAYLCFDEWNVWYKNAGEHGRRAASSPRT